MTLVLTFYAGVACGALVACVYACCVAAGRADDVESWDTEPVRRRAVSLEGSRPCKRAVRP